MNATEEAGWIPVEPGRPGESSLGRNFSWIDCASSCNPTEADLSAPNRALHVAFPVFNQAICISLLHSSRLSPLSRLIFIKSECDTFSWIPMACHLESLPWSAFWILLQSSSVSSSSIICEGYTLSRTRKPTYNNY